MLSILHISEGAWGRAAIYKEKKRDKKESKQNLSQNKRSKQSLHEAAQRQPSTQHYLSDSDDDSIEVEEDKIYVIIPKYLASLYGTILEDTATQLRILVEASNGMKIIKTKSDWNYLLSKKFSVKQGVFDDELDKIDHKRLGCDEYKINKLESDKKYVVDVIKLIYKDLCVKKSYKALGDTVNAILAVDNHRIELAEEEAKNRVLRRDLIRQLRQLRNHIKSVVYDTDVKIDYLTSQVEDAGLYSECRGRYIDRWQDARTEQHHETIVGSETDYTTRIERYKQMTDQEHRVHLEVEMLMNMTINDTLQKVEDIMYKYDGDMESVDLKIQIQKNDYQNMNDKRIELQKVIEEHEKEMNDWIYFKDERERLRLYREKMTNAAIAVQAWWRGLLVRLALGPYKVAKKRGKKKNK